MRKINAFPAVFFSPISACSFTNMKGFPCSPAPLIVFLETTTLIGVFFFSFLSSDKDDQCFLFFSCYESAFRKLLKCSVANWNWRQWHHRQVLCRSPAITPTRARLCLQQRSLAPSLQMLREDEPCLTQPRPGSHPRSQGQPRSTACDEWVCVCLRCRCWAAGLLCWPFHLLTACVLVFSLPLTCMPFVGKKSTLMKLLHLRVHSGFLHSYIRPCVCLCL